MTRTGGCQCGAVRYEAAGEPAHHAVCHCADCRASSGAPMVGWMAFASEQVSVTQGAPTTYAGQNGARRQFCPACGTGLFYTNAAVLPGITEIQSATLDKAADEVPQAHIQLADRLPWIDRLDTLARFDRFPEE